MYNSVDLINSVCCFLLVNYSQQPLRIRQIRVGEITIAFGDKMESEKGWGDKGRVTEYDQVDESGRPQEERPCSVIRAGKETASAARITNG